MYDRLVEYNNKYGTIRVRQKEDSQLSNNWVYRQRKSCKDLTRIRLLNDIDFA